MFRVGDLPEVDWPPGSRAGSCGLMEVIDGPALVRGDQRGSNLLDSRSEIVR